MATEERQAVGSDGAAAQAQEVATQAKEQAREKATEIRERASVRLRGRLDTRSTEMADQIAPFAQALHKAGDHLVSQGNESGGKAAHRAGEQAEQLEGYLRSSGSDRLLGDVEGFARQRPWAAGGIGLVAGFVAARFLRASSENRYGNLQRSYDNGAARDLPLHRDTEAAAPPLSPASSDTW